MNIKEVLEDIKRHLDYVNETNQASIRDNQIKVMYEEIERLKERIDKAVKYITSVNLDDSDNIEDLLKILEGEDKE